MIPQCIVCEQSKNLAFICQHPSFPESKIYECSRCKVAITYPLPTNSQLIEFYRLGFYDKSDLQIFEENLQKNLDKVIQSYEPNHRALSQFNLIKKFSENGDCRKALDIGCSNGSLSVLLEHSGFSILAYEPDYKMFLLANQRLQNPKSIVINKMLDETELESNYHDLVCSSHVLEHLKEPVEHLVALRKSLKNTGILFIEIPNEYGIGIKDFLNQQINPNVKKLGHLYYYSVEAIGKILENNGFEVLFLKTCGCTNESYLYKLKKQGNLSIFDKLKYKLSRRIVYSQVISRWQETRLYYRYRDYDKDEKQGIWIRVIARPVC